MTADLSGDVITQFTHEEIAGVPLEGIDDQWKKQLVENESISVQQDGHTIIVSSVLSPKDQKPVGYIAVAFSNSDLTGFVSDRSALAAMLSLVDELHDLSARAATLSEKRRPRFSERGQLTPRDRLARLLDSGMPFLELFPFANAKQSPYAVRSETQALDSEGRIRFGDFEGDGYADVVLYDPVTPERPLRILRNRGPAPQK